MELPQFSVFEFEQAGLLHELDGRLVAPASALILNASEQRSPHSNPQSQPTSLHGMESAPQSHPQPWQVPLPGPGLIPDSSRNAATQLRGSLGESLVSQSNPLFGQDAHNEFEASRWTNHHQHSAAEAHQQSTDVSQAQVLPTDTNDEAVSQKQANREHQKRFRLRQKVLLHADLSSPYCLWTTMSSAFLLT